MSDPSAPFSLSRLLSCTRRGYLSRTVGGLAALGLKWLGADPSASAETAATREPATRAHPRGEPQARRNRLAVDAACAPTIAVTARPWIEGYCSRQSVKAGETIDIMVSTDPPRPFQIEIFRMGYYGGRGARLMTKLGPFAGKTQPTPEAGPEEHPRMPLGADHEPDDSRPTGPAASTSAGSPRWSRTKPSPTGRATSCSSSATIGRPTSCSSARTTPGRPTIAGPNNYSLYTHPKGTRAPGPTSASTGLTAARRSHGRRERPAHVRLGRVPAVRVSAGLLARTARLRRHLLLEQRHAHARPRAEVQGVHQRRPRRVLGHPPATTASRRCATPA